MIEWEQNPREVCRRRRWPREETTEGALISAPGARLVALCADLPQRKPQRRLFVLYPPLFSYPPIHLCTPPSSATSNTERNGTERCGAVRNGTVRYSTEIRSALHQRVRWRWDRITERRINRQEQSKNLVIK